MLLKKLLRTAKQYKTQFVSMIIMVTIGVGVFVGFNMEWKSIEVDTDRYFAETNFADYRIYSESGFTASDVEKIRAIEGVDGLTRWLAANVGVAGTSKTVTMNVFEEYGVSKFILMKGEEYDPESDGVWLSDQFAEKNDIALGDEMNFSYKSVTITAKVVGLVKSSEYLVCVADGNQLMPDFETHGYAFITPKKLASSVGLVFYPQINVRSELDKNTFEERVLSAMGKTVLIVPKEDHASYSTASGEIEEGQSMGAILPVLFLLIGVLTMVTTMHRITINEKTQIGTLKALGFRNRRILWHYTSYGLVIGIVGTVFGVLLGFGIGRMVFSESGTMGTYFDMPYWGLHASWYVYVSIVALLAFLTLISYLSVKKMLRGTAAETLMPYVPKKMKKVLLERTPLWKKMTFGQKWNTRDILRHKARSAMTLVGIISCMLLLVGGVGMKDSMSGFLKVMEDVNAYESKINVTETATNDEAKALAEKYEGDWVAASNVNFKDKTVSLEIYNTPHELMKFVDEDNNDLKLSSDGVYVCLRVARTGVKAGDEIEISPYGSSETYKVKVAGVIRSLLTENIVMTSEYADKVGIPYHISTVYSAKSTDEIAQEPEISAVQSKRMIMDTYDTFLEIMNLMIAILVLAAVVIGIVVLYNLGVMSYVERKRELATLKVVGFRNKHISKLLVGQNLWLTVLGVAIGLPAGVGLLKFLILVLASEYEMKVQIGALTYLLSVVLTFGVSLAVGFMVARKNKKIDMVEALKGAE